MRSSIFAGVVALAMILATLGLVRAPTPEDRAAAKLRAIAREIAKTATTTDDTALADTIRRAADALQDSKLPPEEKKKRLEEAMRQADKAAQKRDNTRSGKDQGNGKSSAQNGKGSGKGQGNAAGSGTGEGKSGTGAGQNVGGNNPGPGKGGSGNNSGKNQGGKGSAKNDQNKNPSNIELHNELAKAEAQVETANANNPGPDSKPGDDKNHGGANKPGDSAKSGNQADPNKPGDIPKPGANGDRNIPAAGGNPKNKRDMGSNLGDTHLGEMPSSTNAQRFLKPGEKGAGVDIKDARYVMFRIPGAPTSGSGGKTILDTSRPKATTAYVNAPLAPSRDDAPPDERQLVPPRYRDMIR
jgi:hypothetical protein